jgi:hypothetical protein
MVSANQMKPRLAKPSGPDHDVFETFPKLEPNEAAIVLGTAVQYNIAELVDPLVHVVAKIRKSALSEIK